MSVAILPPLRHLQMAHAMSFVESFHNYISVEFIGSMLRNQKPCTPTRRSNRLSTQEETRLATVSVPESNFFSTKNKKSPASFQWKFGEIFVKLSC
jgi:hypothetical protein